MRALAAAPVAVAAALAACGGTLVDHAATQVQPGLCAAGEVFCGAASPQCQPEGPQHCGAACEACGATAVGVPACLGAGSGAGVCGYACTGGLLKCTRSGAGACCPAVRVVAGGGHTCAATADGAVYCWGENGSGEVNGVPSPGSPVTTPALAVAAGAGAIAAGEAHTCAALGDAVRCWGKDDALQAESRTFAVAVAALAAGARHTCALLSTGDVECWGTGAGAGAASPVVTGATAIAAGADHTCALLATGAVACWGVNGSGQLGDATTNASPAPVTPQGLGAGMTLVAAAGGHTCAADAAPGTSNGGSISDAVRCWGDEPGTAFLLAAAQTTPGIPMKDAAHSVIPYGSSTPAAALAAGGAHVCAQSTAAGAGIDCFGANASGQLGGSATGTELVAVFGSPGATSFAAGADHTCAVFAAGGVWCWGSNASGQLGDGTTATPGIGGDPRLLGTPVPVSGL